MKIAAALLLFAATAFPQVASKANEGYKTKEGREKVASTLADPHRDDRQKPAELVESMGLKPGMNVADIGTGVGYMLPYLSRAVGPKGNVFAEDIQTDFLDRAKARAADEHLNNVTFILGDTTDPKLPRGRVQSALVLDTYHHFDYPEKMLANIRSALIPGGNLVIVDFYKSASPSPGHIRLEREEVIKEIEANGFRLVTKKDHIPNSQYLLIFEKI